MLNHKIETGLLISEIIKSNTDVNYSQNFSKYLVIKIVNGYFKSSLIQQLIGLTETKKDSDDEDNSFLQKAPDTETENPNQQFILKQIIKSHRFRQLLYMRKNQSSQKLGIIKTYAKKREQYNISKKPVDEALLEEKEKLDLHLAVVDLVTACAKNSPFGIAQAQKMIEADELLDSLLSDAIPFVVKRHYFRLFFEVYLRKVPTLDESNRVSINDVKFCQVMKWVVLYDIENSFHYYNGLIKEPTSDETPEAVRKIRQVNREVERVSEAEYEDKNAGKTEKDKEDERKFKAQLTSYKDTNAYYVLDTNDKGEYWRYLHEFNMNDRKTTGLIMFIEQFYREYTVRELDDENIIEVTSQIRERLLAMANKIFQFIDSHESYMKPEVHDLLVQINRAVQKIPHIRAFRIGKKRIIKEGVLVEIDVGVHNLSDDSLNVDESRDVDNRMAGDKVLRILRDYIIKENLHIRDAMGIKNITSDHMVSREELKQNIKKITGNQASFDDIMKALDHFHSVSLDKKNERQVMNVEPGQPGYIMNMNEGQINVEMELRQNMINFKDIEFQLKDVLKKAGYKAPNQQRERNMEENETLVPNIKENDFSIAINMDLKLFTQRFFEFVHMTKNFSEIHDFVQGLMNSEYISNKQAKIQLVINLCKGFAGLEGADDEVVLTSILSLIVQRMIPGDNNGEFSLIELKKRQKNVARLQAELREWQDVMFEAQVPQLMFSYIHSPDSENNFLANKALILLNNLLYKTSDKNQAKMLEILKGENRFFTVFYYIKQRLHYSKNYLIEKIKYGARKKFINLNIDDFKKKGTIKPNDFTTQKIYVSQKYDVEHKYSLLKDNWKEEEMNNLLQFLNQLCENCYRPAQIFLREQLPDRENFSEPSSGQITSIDLIYQVVSVFIDIVDELNDYVFSDYRTFKLLPVLMDTLIEFMYGPCIQNQQFLGGWKKLISIINGLIDQSEFGNYSGIHQEAKAQLAILHSCSNVLLAIADIKDEEIAQTTHALMINELDIENLITKMVDIFVHKIGGSPHRKRVYDFQIMCKHYDTENAIDGSTRCIEDEFCEFGHMIPRDINTIQAGFNIYQVLQLFQKTHGDHPKMQVFQRNEVEFIFLQKQSALFDQHIFLINKVTHSKTKDIYNRFNRSEERLLDYLMIKCFPEIFIGFIEKVSSETEDQKEANKLMQQANLARYSNNPVDQQQILERVREKIRDQAKKSCVAEYGRLPPSDPEANMLTENDESTDQLVPNLNEEQPESVKGNSFFGSLLGLFGKKNKVESVGISYEEMELDEKKQQTIEDREEFMTKLKIYKFYKASNFYEDNIGQVEIATGDDAIITTSFQIPSFIQHLTSLSRDNVPYHLTLVSQQEKLEGFVSHMNIVQIEMKWQQRIGAASNTLKVFANKWEILSWINFILIVSINLMFIQYLTINQDTLKIDLERAWQQILIDTVGYIQTACAGIVVLSYYIEYRANLKFAIQKGSKNLMNSIKDYGLNKGSQGYGMRKSNKMNINDNFMGGVNALKKIGKVNVLSKMLYIFFKEFFMFWQAIFYDRTHTRNIIYFWVSMYSSSENGKLFNALLLIDIINKIKTLSQVLSIFNENKIALGSTLLLFVVLLYIAAFYAFQSFRTTYKHAEEGEDGDGYNLYCETLVQCLVSTINYGIRSGGGIGDALEQPMYSDEVYTSRYVFDFLFFMIINIILMNIFFGIIIDSFADKRAGESEIESEVQNQCFICGISKSTFEIENVSWKSHIYQEHNLHSYIAFLIYVKNKSPQECTGIEKWVKACLTAGTISFFPIMKCLSINGGQSIE